VTAKKLPIEARLPAGESEACVDKQAFGDLSRPVEVCGIQETRTIKPH
jgi:hypothetical protein